MSASDGSHPAKRRTAERNDPNQTVDEPGRESGPPICAASTPAHIGRYRIERILGQGGFDLVYLAHDDQLQRLVAIKVPHGKQVDRPEAAGAYLSEARAVANLDHPHIVPVFVVGSTEDCPCYVVSKYNDGTDLATRLKRSRLSVHEAVELVATVAEALHRAHKQGLVHRDIKPGNILLDRRGKPFVADFGLALREQDGGSFTNQASVVRSAFRPSDVPTNRDNLIGFRLARTLPLGSFTALPPTPEGGRK